jgi:hypothetical protein
MSASTERKTSLGNSLIPVKRSFCAPTDSRTPGTYHFPAVYTFLLVYSKFLSLSHVDPRPSQILRHQGLPYPISAV